MGNNPYGVFWFVASLAVVTIAAAWTQDNATTGRWVHYRDWSRKAPADGTYFVLVTADWCAPCQVLKRQIEAEVFPQAINVIVVDFDRDNEVARKMLCGNGTILRGIRYTVNDGKTSGTFLVPQSQTLKQFTGLEK